MLKISTVKETLEEFSSRHLSRLENHDNVLVTEELDNSQQCRRLKRYRPLDLPFRFN